MGRRPGGGKDEVSWKLDASGLLSAAAYVSSPNCDERPGGTSIGLLVVHSISLPPGEYELNYESDGSHSFNDWNDDPPEDRIHWGISLYREK